MEFIFCRSVTLTLCYVLQKLILCKLVLREEGEGEGEVDSRNI